MPPEHLELRTSANAELYRGLQFPVTTVILAEKGTSIKIFHHLRPAYRMNSLLSGL